MNLKISRKLRVPICKGILKIKAGGGECCVRVGELCKIPYKVVEQKRSEGKQMKISLNFTDFTSLAVWEC